MQVIMSVHSGIQGNPGIPGLPGRQGGRGDKGEPGIGTMCKLMIRNKVVYKYVAWVIQEVQAQKERAVLGVKKDL